MLDLKQYFLQDYWKWIPSVCRSQKVNNTSSVIKKEFSYKYYNVYIIKFLVLLNQVDVTLNISAILINTRYDK